MHACEEICVTGTQKHKILTRKELHQITQQGSYAFYARYAWQVRYADETHITNPDAKCGIRKSS